ncbi:hypothetical protein [Mesotoga sp. UBA5557]|uniref:hypothetical protein n=1 Tax=Mesotoga sp. UBA5557 TaxID=1946857 RepID=UPI0025F64262|nr:hypothetical protein [Mesotoga sp. UBA5557]
MTFTNVIGKKGILKLIGTINSFSIGGSGVVDRSRLSKKINRAIPEKPGGSFLWPEKVTRVF